MMALQNSKFRVYPLPALYNFYSSSLYPANGPKAPVVVQTKVFSDPRARVEAYSDVASHVAMIIMEDCLNNIKRVC